MKVKRAIEAVAFAHGVNPDELATLVMTRVRDRLYRQFAERLPVEDEEELLVNGIKTETVSTVARAPVNAEDALYEAWMGREFS